MTFHDIFASTNAVRVLLDGQLFRRALEPKETLDVQFSLLLETSPFLIFRMDGVEADFVDDDTVGEGFVPGVDGQRPVLLVECVPLPEQEVVDAHQLFQKIRSFNVEFGSTIYDVHTICLVYLFF